MDKGEIMEENEYSKIIMNKGGGSLTKEIMMEAAKKLFRNQVRGTIAREEFNSLSPEEQNRFKNGLIADKHRREYYASDNE